MIDQTEDPAKDYATWLGTLKESDFCDEYVEIYMTWMRPIHDHDHDTEDKMNALRAEENRRGINVEIC